MSTSRVLAAAAALRRFSVGELAAFCDESEPGVVAALESAAGRIQRVGDGAEPALERWRVSDLAGLRRDLAVAGDDRPETDPPRHQPSGDETSARLALAEQTLSDCAEERSDHGRRVLFATAQNHLRQVAARALPGEPDWWLLELSEDWVESSLAEHADQRTGVRLLLDISMARIAEREAQGEPNSVPDLVQEVDRVQRLAPELSRFELNGPAGRFVDLVSGLAQGADDDSLSTPARVVTALTRLRVQARVEDDVTEAIRGLGTLLHAVGGDGTDRQLYRLIGREPGGDERVAVYADLLPLLPPNRYRTQHELLPGTLVEAVTEPDVSHRLRRYAGELSDDLRNSPNVSEPGLIGQVAHVLQDLAERDLPPDPTAHARCNDTRSQLLTLAQAARGRPAAARGVSVR